MTTSYALLAIALLAQSSRKVGAGPSLTEIRITGGRFVLKSVKLPSRGKLRFVNTDRETYTVEAPGLLPGDITLPPGASVDVAPLYEAGDYTAMIEEVPTSEIGIRFEGHAVDDPALRETPFDAARRHDRQPLLFEADQEPAYGAYTAFDLTGRSETDRQESLQIIYRLQEQLSGEQPPPELAPYLTAESWARLRLTVGLVIGLGATAYDGKRFGARVAASRPRGLHPFTLASRLGGKISGGRDVILRATSDSDWFNLRVCRLAWSRLGSRIKSPSLESGYAPPRGRSPILGGFFDGIGNPSGADRDRTAYAGGNGSYLALFRIRFDEARFAKLSLASQEKLVGRRKGSGHQITPGASTGHRERAQNDGKSLIVRMPLVFDDGPNNTGLLFGSVQASIDNQFERILRGFMLTKDAKGSRDGLLGYMHFDSAAYYYVPPSVRGSYPGSLRGF